MPPQQGKDDEENWSDEEGETLTSAGISNVWVWVKVGAQQLAALLKVVVSLSSAKAGPGGRTGGRRRFCWTAAFVTRVGGATISRPLSTLDLKMVRDLLLSCML